MFEFVVSAYIKALIEQNARTITISIIKYTSIKIKKMQVFFLYRFKISWNSLVFGPTTAKRRYSYFNNRTTISRVVVRFRIIAYLFISITSAILVLLPFGMVVWLCHKSHLRLFTRLRQPARHANGIDAKRKH